MGQEVRSELIRLLGRLYGTDKGRELSIRLSEGEDQEGLLAEYEHAANEGRGKVKGYVYVLTNEAMPGLVKIGRSKIAGLARAKQIYSGDTGVPVPFEVHFECLFDDCIDAEAVVHEFLDAYRVNPNREFFRMDADLAVVAVLRVRGNELGYAVEPYEMFPCDADMQRLADELGRHPFEVVTALGDLAAADVRRAMLRQHGRMERYRDRREREQGKQQLKIVGQAE